MAVEAHMLAPCVEWEVTMRGQSAALEPGSVLLKASDGYVGIFTW